MYFFHNRTTGTRGFTLIELLVVIAIIGVLSSVVLASVNTGRAKARDAKRQADLHQIQVALELYYDANGVYPQIDPWIHSCDATWNTLKTALAPYSPNLPVDPINGTTAGACGWPWTTGNFTYAYGRVGTTDYDLIAQFENTSNSQRCAVRQWLYHGNGNTTWCGIYSPFMFADH